MNTLQSFYLKYGRDKDVKNAIKYGRDKFSYDTVVSALRSRELELKSETKIKGEGLTVRGRSANKNWNVNGNRSNSKRKTKWKPRSRSRTNGRKCYYCQRERHFIKECFKKKRDDREKSPESGDLAIASNDSDCGEVLVVSNGNSSTEWILDSGCTYHMCPKVEWFHSYNKLDGGQVLLRNIWLVMLLV